jgi:hypothetical protein
MKPKKPKGNEPSLRSKLFRALESDFEAHGVSTIERLRQEHPDRYLDIASRLATVVEQSGGSFDDCNTQEEIARKLLQAVGCENPDEASIQRAVAAHEKMIAGLQAIRAEAEGGIQ